MSNQSKKILVTKASGEKVPYSEEKWIRSIESAGIDPTEETELVKKVESNLSEATTTQEIFKKTYRHLKRHSKISAGRYKLKRAIMELGPTGYPFEIYFGKILSYLGYITRVGIVLPGHCVTHEIDVVAEKDNRVYMVECKFRNRPGFKSDVKIPLYIYSRFKDVERNWKSLPENKGKECQGWVVTNAAFTSDAIQYGNCMNLKMLGWNYIPTKVAYGS